MYALVSRLRSSVRQAGMVFSVVVSLGVSVEARAQTQNRDYKLYYPEVVRRYFQVPEEYVGHAGIANVKVGILANGFGDLEDSGAIGGKDYLPPTYTLFTWNEANLKALDSDDFTGLRAAAAIASLVGATNKNAPQFRLYNANSLGGFQSSMKDAGEWGADILLSFKNYESFGNFNGTGGINPLPERIVRNGDIFWVHSAGQFRGLVRHGTANATKAYAYGSLDGKWIPTHANNYPFLRFKANASLHKVKINLSWNAYPPSQNFEGTDKDLDLVVYQGDKDGRPVKEIARANKRQTLNPESDNETKFPMEELTLQDVAPSANYYLIGVQYANGSFSSLDRFHVTIQPDITVPFIDDTVSGKDAKETAPLEFVDASPDSTLLVPADNPEAYVVGDYSRYSSIGPVLPNIEGKSIPKPQLILDRTPLYFTDSGALEGPDAAATVYAAMAVMMKAMEPGMKPRHFRQQVKNLKPTYSIDSPFLDVEPTEKALQAKGWKTSAKDKENFYSSYQDFQRLGFAKIGGSGFAVMTDPDDDHVKIGVMSTAPDLDAFKDIAKEHKVNPEKNQYWLFIEGKENNARLRAWVSVPVTKDGVPPKPWQVLGGKAKDYFEIVDMSLPVLNYRSTVSKAKRFRMPSTSKLHSLAQE